MNNTTRSSFRLRPCDTLLPFQKLVANAICNTHAEILPAKKYCITDYDNLLMEWKWWEKKVKTHKIKMFSPICALTLPLTSELRNLRRISSIILSLTARGNSKTDSSLENSCFNPFTYGISIKLNPKTTPRQNKFIANQRKQKFTNLTSAIGSLSLRIRTDSSIFLIWSGVYFTTVHNWKKKKRKYY